jgi:isopenicillin-N epimerase
LHQQPDLCYHRRLEPVRDALAKYINATDTSGGKESVVFVENASGGVNSVLRSLKIQPGERILILSTAYPVTSNTLDYLKDWSDGQVCTTIMYHHLPTYLTFLGPTPSSTTP